MTLDPDLCYRAALSRDPRFDGRFFTGVVTTGIYCRPVCPVSPPRRENMRFYARAEAAEAAGFRPCKRCRPETAPGTPAWAGTSAVVARALALVDAGALDDDDVEAFAARVGLGARQLRRLFLRHVGVAPSAVARSRRVHFARRLLDETDLAMAEVAHAAGFASIRQFNHSVKATFGEPPTALRAGRRAAAPAGLALRLALRPPIAWEAMLSFLAARAIPGVEHVADGAYARSVVVDGQEGTVVVRHAGGGDARPHRGEHLLLEADVPRGSPLLGLVDRTRRLFDLGADPVAVGAHLGRDPLLAPRVAATPGLRMPGAWDGFELAVRAVLGQQVTVRGAITLAGRLVARFGRPLERPRGAITHRFPEAAALADADVAAVGLPAARAATIRALAQAVAGGGLVLDPTADPAATVEALLRLPGIGPWTAGYIAMRALGDADAFPSGDLGLVRALASPSGVAPTAAQVEAMAEAWRPWRAFAAAWLWMASPGGHAGGIASPGGDAGVMA